LDEHFSPEIARQLRRRGHDVIAARERPELHGLADRELLRVATAEGRAIVTENVVDFVELHRQSVLGGDPHAGLVFTSPRSFPRTRRGIGKLVRALDALLTDEASDLAGQTWWL
jgi:predicted nuclease of predicted toxin-antitoxin system